MKILVTGGSGLIGSALKNHIGLVNDTDNEWVFINSKDCNLLNVDEVYKIFNSIQPDYIIHLAAEVGGLFKNMNEKVKMLENNLLMNFNVLKIAHELDIENIMCCLSTCIFPDKVEYPISESSLHNGSPHNSNYAYAYAKRMLDIHCRVYREQYNRKYFCIIPTNVYGPNDNYNLKDGHVIPALIHQCFLSKQSNRPFFVKGTGSPLRQFIYSKDIASCIYHLVFHYTDYESIILSINESDEISIGDIAKLIAKCMNYNNIVFQPEYADGQYKKTVNNKFLLSLLPNTFQFTSIEKGILESVQWFCDNYENARV